jgi:hypothetical protein
MKMKERERYDDVDRDESMMNDEDEGERDMMMLIEMNR